MPGVTTAYQTGVHGSRPANGTGCILYSCTTHNKVYRDDGTTWIDFLVLPSAGLTDPMTTRGDMIVRNSSNATARLAVGAADRVLKSDGTDPAWGQVTPAMLDVSADNTTANATSGHHGLLPKLSGSSSDALLGDGTWGAAGGGSSSWPPLDQYLLDGTHGDHFTAASLSGSWTRRNYTSGAETYQVGKNGTYLRIDTTSRSAGDGYFRTAPGGDWTIAMKYIPRYYGATFPNWSLCVVDTAGTGVGTVFYNAPLALLVADITTYTTYGGTYTQLGSTSTSPNKAIFAAVSQWLDRPIWVSLRKSGTSYFGACSLDGEVWTPETGGRTWAGTVDRIGMFHMPTLGSTQGSGTPNVTPIDVDWFNKIA